MLKKISIISFILTLATAFLQKVTGPTYPIKGKIQEGKIEYRLPRSCTIGKNDCLPKIFCDADISAYLMYRRYKTEDVFFRVDLERSKEKGRNFYFASIAQQPPAGKVEYMVYVNDKGVDLPLTDKPVITRFKGNVPPYILIPHIVFMFLFMFFSIKIFLMSNVYDIVLRREIFLNFFFLLLGGMIFGPITQYYAFGKFWTGFPLGHDLTDNKTLIMLLLWLWPLYHAIRDKKSKFAINLAFAVTFIVYLIPHSLLGSELDYSKYNAGK